MSFKINYKGTDCRGTTFLYYCGKCTHEQEETHPASEEPMVVCPECHYTMNKKPTAVNMDADYHDGCKAHNIGWDL